VRGPLCLTPARPSSLALLDHSQPSQKRHWTRLKRLIALRLDPRLAAHVDPSDAVQEALAKADRRLDRYLRERPLPFYPWLRQLVQDRVTELYRQHVRAERPSVTREQDGATCLRSRPRRSERCSISAPTSIRWEQRKDVSLYSCCTGSPR
jgi:DNA-directed RNA polymerase specialized sigma24 family protein